MTPIFITLFSTLFACADSEARHLPESIETADVKELPISTKPKLNVIVVEADSTYHIWLEGRSGVLRSKTNDTFWLENGGVAISLGQGQYNIEVDGHNYLTLKKRTTLPLKQKIETAPKNTSSYKLILDMTDRGVYVTQIQKPAGRTTKLATSKKKPTASAVLTVSNKTDLYGKPNNILNASEKSSVLTNKGMPSTAKKIEVVSPSADTINKWKSAMQGFYGGTPSIDFATMINLDQDEAAEGFFCSTATGAKKCYVVDTIKSEERFYLSDFNWNPKGAAPVLFATDHGNYISHKQQLSKSTITKVLRFDGSGYTTDRL